MPEVFKSHIEYRRDTSYVKCPFMFLYISNIDIALSWYYKAFFLLWIAATHFSNNVLKPSSSPTFAVIIM